MISNKESDPRASNAITKSGDEGTLSKLWPTVRINSKTADRFQNIVGYQNIRDQSPLGEIRVGASNRFKGIQDFANQ